MDSAIRERYADLKTRADAAYAAAEPQRKALVEAEKPWNALQDEIDELVDGQDVETCGGCLGPIFQGEPSHRGDDIILCQKCSPTYADLLDHPRSFLGANEDPMTEQDAKIIVDAHISSGGSLSDPLAN